jgi:hypothetical protein
MFGLHHLLTGITICFAVTVLADDWPQWREPERSNVSRETGLLKEWPANGPPLLWKLIGLGTAFLPSTPVESKIANPKYLISKNCYGPTRRAKMLVKLF